MSECGGEEVKKPSDFGFKQRNIRRQVTRKRKGSEDGRSEESEGGSAVVRKTRKSHDNNPNYQSTHTAKKMSKLNTPDESDADIFKFFPSYPSKRRAEPEGLRDMGATAKIQIETEVDKDVQAIYEKLMQKLKGKEDDKAYRGMINYTQFYEKKDTTQGNVSSGMTHTAKKMSKLNTSDESDADIFKFVPSYPSKRRAEPEGPRDMGATAKIQIETEVDKNVQAIYETLMQGQFMLR